MPACASADAAFELIKTDKSKILGLTVNGKSISPGDHIPKAEAQKEPQISYTGGARDATYILICLDLDAPFASFPILGPILHWTHPGFKLNADGTLTTPDPYIANYIGPAPPPMSGPHRYLFMLYNQPAQFEAAKHAPADGQEFGHSKRMRYDLGAFEKKAGLGPILAANYFVSN